MNYSHRKYEDQVWRRDKKFDDDEYLFISHDEFKALIGTATNDIYDNLDKGEKGWDSYFMPERDFVNDDYMGAIIDGTASVFRKSEIIRIDPYRHAFHGLEYVAKEVRQYDAVLAYFPKRFHRQGDLKDQLIIDDRSFTYSIFAKVMPDQYDAFMKRQNALWKRSKDENDPKKVRITKELYNKLKKQNREYSKKGRSAQKIANRQKTLKRKREQMEKCMREASQNVVQDRIYQPPVNLQEDNMPPIDKDLVCVNEYMKVRKEYLNLNHSSNKLIQNAQRIPWISTLHLQNNQERLTAYNLIREQILVEFSWANIQIPTLEQAWNLYNNSNN